MCTFVSHLLANQSVFLFAEEEEEEEEEMVPSEPAQEVEKEKPAQGNEDEEGECLLSPLFDTITQQL